MRSTVHPGIALLPVVALSAVSLLACGDVTPIAGIAPDEAPRRLAEAICPKAYECCMTDQLTGNMQAGTDVASCETKTREAFENQVATIKASQKKGRVVYDGLKVQACVDRFTAPSTTCADLNTTNHFSGVPECASFLQPRVAPGGACGASFECFEGFCDTSAVPEGSVGDGVCKPFPKAGEACSAEVPCGAELTCDATAMTCTAARPPGGPAADACFYSSACNFAGGDRGAASLLTVGLLLGAMVRRRRRR
jgi:uncharacterized protein (TIGR03382 family)